MHAYTCSVIARIFLLVGGTGVLKIASFGKIKYISQLNQGITANFCF